MRPISLTDECLDDFDREDLNEFILSDTPHGRRIGKNDVDSALEEEDPDPDQEIMDLVSKMDVGIVDYE